MRAIRIFSCLVFLVLMLSCGNESKEKTLFQLLAPKETGVDFVNTITTSDSVNLLTYEYLYNGGGVGIGHFNKDSLPDVIFTGNMENSRIYINKGSLKFDDITDESGIDTSNKWCTGVSVVDINADGLDDIYIGVGGMGNKDDFPNLLYINQGDATFVESAKEYGLADKGESIQSIFFDYDKDGDLDMYLLTGGGFEHSAIALRPMITSGNYRNTDRLYRNDFNEQLGHPVFTNVSREAGINIEGFGLGISVMDANNDSWPDLYVSNDYLSRDLLYINQKNGTFSEEALTYFGHTSQFSMGNDIADINNDGLMDVITLDMLPENHKRRKLMSGPHSYDMFQMAKGFGYGHQYMRNMMHVNNGNGHFSEIGQLLGIDRTDWSWAPLISDFNNDGHNDIFITNGFGKDVTDLDFVKFRKNGSGAFANPEALQKSILDCLIVRPSIKLPNYIFKNKGKLNFENSSKTWGFNQSSISNGAAYADLDMDGDLELVVNNINQPAFIYKNNTREYALEDSNYIQIELHGDAPNTQALGSMVSVYYGGSSQRKELQPIRGFETSVERKLHFGLGSTIQLDSVRVHWPDNKETLLKNVQVNQLIHLNYAQADTVEASKKLEMEPLLKADSLIVFKHLENTYNDFNVQPLLNHGFSNQGPGLAVGDLNADGLQDVFIGGSYGVNAVIFFQDRSGNFNPKEIPDTEIYEDLGALIFDANGDGLQDVYVVSGGSERYIGHEAYQDRLLLNSSNAPGTFVSGNLPNIMASTASVTGGDFDQDGDIDLFVGGRVVPGSYPQTPKSYLLENRNGQFFDVTEEIAPSLRTVGMVSSAVWTDFDNDTFLDLVVVGEFMPITIFKGDGSQLINITDQTVLAETNGLWNSIVAEDFDNDGDTDFVLGNLGLNSAMRVNEGHALRLHYADFDDNGYVDPIFSVYEEGDHYPLASLDELTKQLPHLKKRILRYNTYARSTTQDILELLKPVEPATLESKVVQSSYVENLGDNKFKISALPIEAQFAPVYGMLAEDINLDGFLDVILVGNMHNTEVVYGRYDASVGLTLINDGQGSFVKMNNAESGFMVGGDSKSLVRLDMGKDRSLVLVGRNGDTLASFVWEHNDIERIAHNANETTALLFFENGTERKVDLSLGSGYLSQTSKSIMVSPEMTSVQFLDSSGKKTRTLDLKAEQQ